MGGTLNKLATEKDQRQWEDDVRTMRRRRLDNGLFDYPSRSTFDLNEAFMRRLRASRGTHPIQAISIRRDGGTDSREMVPEMLEVLAEFPSLRGLRLEMLHIGEVKNEFALLKNLEELQLRLMEVGDGFMRSVPAGVCDPSFNPFLRVLCLEDNHLYTLPEEVGNLKNLQKLDVTRNRLKEVPRSLATLWDLIDLDLSHNKLEYEAARMLSIASRSMKCLLRLDVGHNGIDSEGIKLLYNGFVRYNARKAESYERWEREPMVVIDTGNPGVPQMCPPQPHLTSYNTPALRQKVNDLIVMQLAKARDNPTVYYTRHEHGEEHEGTPELRWTSFWWKGGIERSEFGGMDKSKYVESSDRLKLMF